MRKFCGDELKNGCPDCDKVDMFGEICHAYQGYQDGLRRCFDCLHECCQNSHLLVNCDGEDFKGCFLLEGFGKITREKCECKFEKCPLIKSYK